MNPKINRLVRKRRGLRIKPNFRYRRKAKLRINRKLYVTTNKKLEVLMNLDALALRYKYIESLTGYKRLALEKLRTVRSSHGKGYRIVREVIGIFKLIIRTTEGFKNVKYIFSYEDLQSMLVSLMPFVRLKETYRRKTATYKAVVASEVRSMSIAVRWIYIAAMNVDSRNISLGVALTLWDVFLRKEGDNSVLKASEDYLKLVYSKQTWHRFIFEKYIRHLQRDMGVFATGITSIWWDEKNVFGYRRVFVLNMKLLKNKRLNIIKTRVKKKESWYKKCIKN